MSPSSSKIPALLTKNSAQPCQIESCGAIMWIRVRPIDDDDEKLLVVITQSAVSGFCYALNRGCNRTINMLHFYIYPYGNLLDKEIQITVSGFCYAQNRVCCAKFQ